MTSVPPSPYDPAPGTPAAAPQPGTAPGGAPQAQQPPQTQQTGGYDPAVPGTAGPRPGEDLSADLGAALRFTANGLLRNPAAVLVSSAIHTVLLIVLMVLGMVLMFVVLGVRSESWIDEDTLPLTDVLLSYAAFAPALLLMMVVSLLWQTGAARAAGIIRDGGRPTIGQALIGPGRVVLTALLVGLIVFVGTLLLYVPGLIAAVLLMFALPAAVRGASPGQAVKESVALVRANLGTSIVAYLVILVASSLAGTFLLPILVLMPATMLLQTGLYERLRGHTLVDPARA